MIEPVPHRSLLARPGRLMAVVALVAASAPLGVGAVRAAPPAIVPVQHVVVIAIPALRWSDLSPVRTPNLWAFAATAARGMLVVKSADRVASCADGMTTLGAGNRATATRPLEASCLGDVRPDPALWSGLRRANKRRLFGTKPGALADALAAHGLGAQPAGIAGATLAAAKSDGTTPSETPAVVVIGLGDLYRAPADDRRARAQAVDGLFASALTQVPKNAMTIVVGSSDDSGGPAGLRVAMIAGGGFTSGRLSSESTGRTPYVELIDVAPTVLTALDEPTPSSMVGQPWHVASRDTSLAHDVHAFVDIEKHAARRAYWGGRFVRFLVIAGALTCVVGTIMILSGVRRRRPLEATMLFCYFIAGIPVSSSVMQLLPWWRWPMVTGFAAVAVVDLALAIVALLASRRAPWDGLAVVVGATAVVLALDMLSGTHLQLNGLLGDSTVGAGRFHGAGNTDFALFATAMLLSAGVLATRLLPRGRRSVLAAVVVLGVVALVLEAAPQLGDDLGGVIALAPALVVLALLVSGVRLSVRTWLVAIGVGIAAGLALLAYDLVAGGGHIGRFAHAGSGGARVTLDRKLAASLASWHSSDYVGMVMFVVVTLIVLGRDRLRSLFATAPMIGAAFAAVAICAVLGTALNDSGVVVLGAAAVVAVPLLLSEFLRPSSGTAAVPAPLP